MVLERPTVGRIGRNVHKEGALVFLQPLAVPGQQMGFAITGRRGDCQTTNGFLLAAPIDDLCDKSFDFLVEEIRVVNDTPGGLDDLVMKGPGTQRPKPLV
jgi:hypothetical protein